MYSDFDLYTPGTMTEALEILAKTKADHMIIAGGTDAVIQLQDGQRSPRHVISISRIGELHGVSGDGETIRIGAGSTFSELEQNHLLRTRVRVLSGACAEVGSPQIRNLGTIGGNVVNASVAGDSITALLALDASLVLKSLRGDRVVKLRDYYAPASGLCIQPDELLTDLIFQCPDDTTATAFHKLGKRNALAIVDISGAAVLRWNAAGICEYASVRGGALARFPLRFTEAEQYLVGRPVTRDTLFGCMNLLSEAVYQSIKHRPLEVGYKKESVRGVFECVFEDLLAQYAVYSQAAMPGRWAV